MINSLHNLTGAYIGDHLRRLQMMNWRTPKATILIMLSGNPSATEAFLRTIDRSIEVKHFYEIITDRSTDRQTT